MPNLLNAGALFQELLERDKPEGATVAADLNVDSFDEVPFITHNAVISRQPDGLWSVTLTVNVFVDTVGAHAVVSEVYAAITLWGEDPDAGIVADVGAVEDLEDLNAFIPVSGEVVVVNKAIRHYQGTFNIVARAH